MHTLYRYKIVFFSAILLVQVFRIDAQTKNLPLFDESKWIHFGFTLGTNVGNFKYEWSPSFYTNDTLATVGVSRYPGVTLGAVSDLHIGPYFDFRILPSLVLAERSMLYTFKNYKTTRLSTESIFAEIPVHFKLKSVRHTNWRFYVIGGGKFSYDFGSDATAARNPNNPIFAIQPISYAYEYGFGLDLYTYYFKFSPEIKLSRGLTNILDPYTDVYSSIFSKVFSNFIFISFHFEG